MFTELITMLYLLQGPSASKTLKGQLPPSAFVESVSSWLHLLYMHYEGRRDTLSWYEKYVIKSTCESVTYILDVKCAKTGWIHVLQHLVCVLVFFFHFH